MIHIEKEAKEKWCTFARQECVVGNSAFTGASNTGVNSYIIDGHVKIVKCITDKCMAWCWQSKYENLGYCGRIYNGK